MGLDAIRKSTQKSITSIAKARVVWTSQNVGWNERWRHQSWNYRKIIRKVFLCLIIINFKWSELQLRL